MTGVVLYDGLYVRGGAEQVTLNLAREFGADLVCAARDEAMFPAHEIPSTCRTLSRSLPAHPVVRLLHGAWMFRRRTGTLGDYDWALYSGSTAPLAALGAKPTRSFYYCHTVPRFIYDLREFYLDRIPAWKRPALQALGAWLRPRYEAAVARIDTIIANSENVRQRIQRYLRRDSIVVHPPCDIEGFRWIEQGDYYLSTARLEPYKRVDLIVRAFQEMPDRKLLVASGGSDEGRLMRLAAGAPNIRFVGWQSPAALRELTGRALATVYIPRDEDFGMSPVESMAAGKPVIGVAEGGLLETVLPGETGLLMRSDPTVQDVIRVVAALDAACALSMRAACERRAKLYSRDRFEYEMRKLIFSGHS